MNCKPLLRFHLLATIVLVAALAVRLQAGVFMHELPNDSRPGHYQLQDAFRSFDEVVGTDGAIVRFDIPAGTVRSFLGSDNRNQFSAHEATSAGFYEISDRPQFDHVLRFMGMTGSFLNTLAGGFEGMHSTLGPNGKGHRKESVVAERLRDRPAGMAFGKLNAMAQAALKRSENPDRSRRAGKGGSHDGGGAGGDSARPIVGEGVTTGTDESGTSGELPVHAVEDPVHPTQDPAHPIEDTGEAEPPVIAIPITVVDGLPGVGGETPLEPVPLPIIDEILTEGPVTEAPGGVGPAPVIANNQAAQVVPEANSLIVWLLGLVAFGYLSARRRSGH